MVNAAIQRVMNLLLLVFLLHMSCMRGVTAFQQGGPRLSSLAALRTNDNIMQLYMVTEDNDDDNDNNTNIDQQIKREKNKRKTRLKPSAMTGSFEDKVSNASHFSRS